MQLWTTFHLGTVFIASSFWLYKTKIAPVFCTVCRELAYRDESKQWILIILFHTCCTVQKWISQNHRLQQNQKLRYTCFNGSKMPFKILSKLYVKKKSHVPMCKLSSYWIGCLLCIFLKILLVKNECPPPVCTKFLLVQLSYCVYSSDSYWLTITAFFPVYTKF